MGPMGEDVEGPEVLVEVQENNGGGGNRETNGSRAANENADGDVEMVGS